MATSLNRLSRRDLLISGCTATASLAGVTKLLAQTNSRSRVLALIGDRYHNPDYIRGALTRMFDGLKISVDYTMLYDKLSRSLLKDYQVFLCLRDGMIWPGGYLGPDLSNVGATRRLSELRDAMLNPKEIPSEGYRPLLLHSSGGKQLRAIAKHYSNWSIEFRTRRTPHP